MPWTQIDTTQYPIYLDTEAGLRLATEAGDELQCDNNGPIPPDWRTVPQYPRYLVTESDFNLVTEYGAELLCDNDVPISPSWHLVSTE